MVSPFRYAILIHFILLLDGSHLYITPSPVSAYSLSSFAVRLIMPEGASAFFQSKFLSERFAFNNFPSGWDAYSVPSAIAICVTDLAVFPIFFHLIVPLLADSSISPLEFNP